jgi:hypothetical protein
MHSAPDEDVPSGAQASEETAPASLTRQQIYEARRTDYNKLVANARLLALILEKVDFKIQAGALSADKSELKRRLFPKTKIMSTGLDDGTCVANVIWEVDIKIKNKNVCALEYCGQSSARPFRTNHCPRRSTLTERVGRSTRMRSTPQ